MAPSILLDDTALAANFNLLGNTWTRLTGQGSVYNGTLSVWDTGTPSLVPPELYLLYYGTEINFYGTITDGLAANYTIDGTTRRPVPFPIGITAGKASTSNISDVSEGVSHLLNLFPSAGKFMLDYVTYTPNSDTTLDGMDLILDDGDEQLNYYVGQWNHTTGDFTQGRPYNGTMTGTNIKGATMEVSFEGSDISVYGLLNQVGGRLSASFVVDGQTASATAYTPFNGFQTVDASTWTLSQQFFHKDLAPGQHTLLVTLTDVSDSQMLRIDSVMFEGTSLTTLTGPSSSNATDPSNYNTSGWHAPSIRFPIPAISGIVFVVVALSLVAFAYFKPTSLPRPTRAVAITEIVTVTRRVGYIA